MSQYIARDALSRMNLAHAMIPASATDITVANLRQLAEVTDETLEQASADRQRQNMMGAYGYRSVGPEKPFAYSDGVAVIPIHGTLINRFYGSWGYATGYNFIRSQLAAALDDEDVKLIVFDVNSYGGEAAGCFELADEIREARIQKSLLAVIDSNCCSAAYALASGADRMILTPSGQAGSIGVIAMHVNIGEALKKSGIEVTIIAEGAHKADGNPYEALSPEVLKETRASVAKSYGKFVDLVVKNRPKLDSKAVRATESRSYKADDALALKLIDAIQTPTEAVASFLAELGSDQPLDQEDDKMTTAPDATETASADSLAQAAAAAKTAERARISSIQGSEEAKGNPALASHLALNTDMSVADAKAALVAGKLPEPAPTPAAAAPAAAAPAAPAAPETAAATGTGALAAAMAQSGGGAGVGAGDDEAKPSRAQAALAMIGRKPKETASAARH